MHIPRRFWQFKLRPNQKKTPLHSGAFLVPVTGLEPVRCRQRWILSPLRLPIPTHRQVLAYYSVLSAAFQEEILRHALFCTGENAKQGLPKEREMWYSIF